MIDTTRIHHVLAADPVWAAYALADLQPAFAPFSHWQIGHSAAGDGVALLFTALKPPPLFTMGPVDAVEEALAQMALPAAIYLTIREEHLPLLEGRYVIDNGLHKMWRMVRRIQRAADWATVSGLVRLQRADSEEIGGLYAHGGPFTPDMFDPYQIDDGVFFGVKAANGTLLAVGGTHIIDRKHSAAAIGNMYTHPAQRGRGYAGAVLGAIVASLEKEQITTIVLNVDQQNPTARRLYEKHGFQIHLPYIEGTVRCV